MSTRGEAAPAGDESPWAPLRSGIFFALFVSQLVSNLGTLMQSVGAAWLMGDLGATAGLIALVQTATFLPVFLVGIPAGAMADVLDRRTILVWTQAAMAAVAAVMAVLTFTDSLSPSGVLALTFLLGIGAALMGPAWMAIQPDLVPKRQFGQAVALGAMTYNVGRAVGPAIGGLVIAAAGPGWVFAINAASFGGTLVVLARWKPRAAPETSFPTETFTGAAVAGLRYGIHSPLVQIVLVRVAILILPGAAVQALLPIVVRGPLGWGSGGYGILLGSFGAGAALSAVFRPRLQRVLHPDAVMASSAVVLAGTLLVQGYIADRWAVGAALFAGGFMWSLATTATTVVAQAAMPAWVRARGMALYSLVLTGSVAVGSALAGLIASHDLGAAHLVAAIVIVISPLAVVRWPMTWPREFDLTVLPGDTPVVALAPAPTDGPVLVTVTYRVPPAAIDEFGALMQYVEKHRRRTGGFRWGLFRDLSDPDRFVETFLVSSWAEHLRQHHRRTASSDEILQRLRPYVDRSGRGIGHYISSSSITSSRAGGGRSRLDPPSTPAADVGFTEEV